MIYWGTVQHLPFGRLKPCLPLGRQERWLFGHPLKLHAVKRVFNFCIPISASTASAAVTSTSTGALVYLLSRTVMSDSKQPLSEIFCKKSSLSDCEYTNIKVWYCLRARSHWAIAITACIGYIRVSGTIHTCNCDCDCTFTNEWVLCWFVAIATDHLLN